MKKTVAAVFDRIFVFARQHRANKGVYDTLLRLVSFFKVHKIAAYVESGTGQHFALDLPALSSTDLGKQSDLMLVVGGDGSLLEAAKMAVMANVPVMGINRGRLGFLTDLPPEGFDTVLLAILQGHYLEESRFLLQTEVQHTEACPDQHIALNDSVLSRGKTMHLLDFEMYINQQYVCHYRADGLIVSTPTGSTAYALSAGGPIIHPGLNALAVVPMFPHTLSSRPLVIDADSVVTIIINADYESDVVLSCDGIESYDIKPGTRMVFRKNDRALRLLHPEDYHYFDTLRMKLGWQLKQNQ